MILSLGFIGFVLFFLVPVLVPRHKIFSFLKKRKKSQTDYYSERYIYPKKY